MRVSISTSSHAVKRKMVGRESVCCIITWLVYGECGVCVCI